MPMPPIPAPRRALRDIPLLDVDKTRIECDSEVEQIAVDPACEALARRLNQRGEVIGRSRTLVFVCFAGERYPVGVRPDLLRVVAVAQGHSFTHNTVIAASEGGTP